MAKFDTYREAFPNARLGRKPNGVLEVALHTDGGKLLFNGHTHEQFVHLFHMIGEDHQDPRTCGRTLSPGVNDTLRVEARRPT